MIMRILRDNNLITKFPATDCIARYEFDYILPDSCLGDLQSITFFSTEDAIFNIEFIGSFASYRHIVATAEGFANAIAIACNIVINLTSEFPPDMVAISNDSDIIASAEVVGRDEFIHLFYIRKLKLHWDLHAHQKSLRHIHSEIKRISLIPPEKNSDECEEDDTPQEQINELHKTEIDTINSIMRIQEKHKFSPESFHELIVKVEKVLGLQWAKVRRLEDDLGM